MRRGTPQPPGISNQLASMLCPLFLVFGGSCVYVPPPRELFLEDSEVECRSSTLAMAFVPGPVPNYLGFLWSGSGSRAFPSGLRSLCQPNLGAHRSARRPAATRWIGWLCSLRSLWPANPLMAAACRGRWQARHSARDRCQAASSAAQRPSGAPSGLPFAQEPNQVVAEDQRFWQEQCGGAAGGRLAAGHGAAAGGLAAGR